MISGSCLLELPRLHCSRGEHVLWRPHPKPHHGPETPFPLTSPQYRQGGQEDTIAPVPSRYQSSSPHPGSRNGSHSLSHLVPGGPWGADAGQGPANRDFGPRPGVAISGQGKDRPTVNGARHCPPVPDRAAPAPDGASARVPPAPGRGPEPGQAVTDSRKPPGSPQPGPQAPVEARRLR